MSRNTQPALTQEEIDAKNAAMETEMNAKNAEIGQNAPDGVNDAVNNMIATALAKAEEAAQSIIENATKQAEKIMAKASKNKKSEDDEEVPDKNTMTAEQTSYLDEKLPITLFKDKDKYKDDVTVIINGKAWVIKRGVQVMLPRFVVLALDDSQMQEGYTSDVINGFTEDYKQKEDKLK